MFTKDEKSTMLKNWPVIPLAIVSPPAAGLYLGSRSFRKNGGLIEAVNAGAKTFAYIAIGSFLTFLINNTSTNSHQFRNIEIQSFSEDVSDAKKALRNSVDVRYQVGTKKPQGSNNFAWLIPAYKARSPKRDTIRTVAMYKLYDVGPNGNHNTFQFSTVHGGRIELDKLKNVPLDASKKLSYAQRIIVPESESSQVLYKVADNLRQDFLEDIVEKN